MTIHNWNPEKLAEMKQEIMENPNFSIEDKIREITFLKSACIVYLKNKGYKFSA